MQHIPENTKLTLLSAGAWLLKGLASLATYNSTLQSVSLILAIVVSTLTACNILYKWYVKAAGWFKKGGQ